MPAAAQQNLVLQSRVMDRMDLLERSRGGTLPTSSKFAGMPSDGADANFHRQYDRQIRLWGLAAQQREAQVDPDNYVFLGWSPSGAGEVPM